MSLSITEFTSTFENHYKNWVQSGEKRKEIGCRIEDIDLTIFFNEGYFIYPMRNSPTPAVIENSVNISSSDNEKIKGVFEKFLRKDEECYRIPSDKNNRFDKFEVRYFSSVSNITTKLQEEERRYAKIRSPRWCTLS